MSELTTYEDVKNEIRRLDPDLDEKDAIFETASLLLASAVCGPSGAALRRFTGLSQIKAYDIARKFRKAGLWIRKGPNGNAISHSGWFDEKEGGLAFWMDVCCAQGLLERT